MPRHLELRDICIMADGKPLIEVDCIVAPGQVLTLMGPSGVGKSSLLSYITGTLARGLTGQGQVLLEGQDITRLPPHKRRVGILFQDDLLFPHLSVGQNLAFGLRQPGRRADRRKEIETNLAEIGLEGFYDRDPATLSGGQASRVQLLRTLLADPHALLLDEAFARLDANLRGQVRTMVFARARERQLPVLMVTHDAEDARAADGPVIELRPY